VATGGNIEALAKLAAAPADAQGMATLSTADLRGVIDLLARLPFHERMAQLGLREDRADVILPAAMVYLHLAIMAGASEILVPGVGVKEGILLDLVDEHLFGRTHEVRIEEQLTKAAVSLGRRFMFDEAHGLHVAGLAVSLFDQLQELHGLGSEDRSLLQAASILHEIGTFLGFKRHHKHALYLLSNSELPGLSPTEMLVVANIARYHRKNIPRENHPEFMQLSEGDRERTTTLAAILRVANALDRSHIQKVRRVRVEIRKKEIVLHLDGEGDLILERWAVSRRKVLFSRVFKRNTTIAN
jgi:exopolyphosphatase/guanosine-5'-triphosphate,3'-diphosphate pyrophosphatase